jgi:hypothetical protein
MLFKASGLDGFCQHSNVALDSYRKGFSWLAEPY